MCGFLAWEKQGWAQGKRMRRQDEPGGREPRRQARQGGVGTMKRPEWSPGVLAGPRMPGWETQNKTE